MSPPALWVHALPQSTRLDTFRRYVNNKHDVALNDYPELHKWSVIEQAKFYQDLWDFCGVIASRPPSPFATVTERLWPRPQWYPGARLNFSENLLAVGLVAHPDKVAVSAFREGGTQAQHFTWRQLEQTTALYACALKHAGIEKGDRVAAVMTNSIEALLIMLATGSIGAIFSSTAPDMGTKGIVERFAQIQPKILFVESEVLYGGKTRDLRSKLKEAVHKLSQQVTTISNIVLITGHAWIGSIRAITLSDFLNVPIQPLEFVQLPFDHPMYIVYSSGTTGPPKCIVHSAGGSLLKHKQDMSLMMDLGIDSTYYQYTTTGWMMWNVLVGGLSTGARVILYDGNPLHPSPSAQLRFIEEQGVTHWGTSPKFLATLKHDLDGFLPPKLDALQVTLVAGSPLSLGLCDWFYSTFPKHVALNNGSGGTDVLGCIIGGNSLMPVYGIELAGPALGMDVQVWDAAGRNIAATGDKGELVIVTPFPSMPVSFWGENGVEEYRKAYFDRYPGIWCHGDFVSMNPKTGGYLIHGRSDGVLNPGGVRFGTAELYEIISSKFPAVEDCVAVGQRRPNEEDEQVLLFIKLKEAKPNLDDSTRRSICNAIRTSLSARHVPAYVLQVQDIPYTLNGKRIENVVKSVVCGDVPNLGSAIVNPESLEEYKQFFYLPIARQLVPKL